jgi:hypothetical protein
MSRILSPARSVVRDLSELAPKIHVTAVDRGFGGVLTPTFCVKQ